MNKRAIAILLALLLCLPCACLANGEEAAEPSEKVQAEEAQKAEPQPASSERAEEPARANESASSAQESGDAAATKSEADIAVEDIAAESGEAENVAEQPNPAAEEAPVENASPEDADIGEGTSEPESGNEPEPQSGDAEVEDETGGDPSGEGDPGTDPGTDPSPESTPDPDATPTPDPEATPNPDATPSPDTSPDPDATPEPETGLRVSVEGATQLEDGSWQIPISSQEDKLRFSWPAVEGATGYAWEIVDADGKSVATGSQAETALELAARDYLTGRFTLVVHAELPEGAEPQEARCTFELKQAEHPSEEQPGNRPSGGFGGGSRPSGGTSSASGGAGQGEGGLQITPGEALTSDHASGSKDMTAYGAVALSIGSATQTQLTLGDMELGVSRADGGSFTAKIADGALRLSAEDGVEWSVNALALEVLARSGLDELTLISGEQSLSLPTNLTLGGPIYASYRAQGYVSKDFDLRATPTGIAVYVDGERYALNADGTIARE